VSDVLLLTEAPIDLTGEQAWRLAEAELADPAYQSLRPGLIERGWEWVLATLQSLSDRAGSATPGGWIGLLGLGALVTVALLLLRWRLGPLQREPAGSIHAGRSTTAQEFMQRADRAAELGRWEEATSLRMNGIVRSGEERGMILPQPGWTADEVADQMGRLVPSQQQSLTAAARTFDEVRFGGRPAGPVSHAVIDSAAQGLREAVSGPP
jgi:hypothetical protein